LLKRIIVQGLQKKGFRFYLFDNNWTEFKKLINEIDKAYDETGKPRGSSARRVTGQTNKPHRQDIINFQYLGTELLLNTQTYEVVSNGIIVL